MGRRDYRHREPKKAKKDTKKISPLNFVSTPANVEVIKKVHKKKEEEEEG